MELAFLPVPCFPCFHQKFIKMVEDIAFDIRDFIKGRSEQEVNPPFLWKFFGKQAFIVVCL
jgi:hypothetical protein